MEVKYIEHLDLLLLASEDGNIYVWGFDGEARRALQALEAKRHKTETVDVLVNFYNESTLKTRV